jgi:RNA polymerase sigma-70 factor (sigma-E family)
VTTEAELERFVQVRYVDLLRTAYLLTGSAHDAEDLVQTALLQALRRWATIDDPMAYLRRSMSNLHISRWRRHRAREWLTSIIPDRRQRDATDDLPERHRLFDALRRLPPRMRAVVVLRYWADLSEADTAAALGCSVGSVKSMSSRGLTRLREALDGPPQEKHVPVGSEPGWEGTR